jgi:hypothetical protein
MQLRNHLMGIDPPPSGHAADSGGDVAELNLTSLFLRGSLVCLNPNDEA